MVTRPFPPLDQESDVVHLSPHHLRTFDADVASMLCLDAVVCELAFTDFENCMICRYYYFYGFFILFWRVST
jgi:hypothetical protein